MQIRDWLANAEEALGSSEVRLRVTLKSGNEIDVDWDAEVDVFGDEDVLSNGNYMIDTRSIAAIQLVGSR